MLFDNLITACEGACMFHRGRGPRYEVPMTSLTSQRFRAENDVTKWRFGRDGAGLLSLAGNKPLQRRTDGTQERKRRMERNSDSLFAPRSKGGVRETRANRESAKAGLDGLMKHPDRKFNALLDILRFVD